jgi:hypothetical protein
MGYKSGADGITKKGKTEGKNLGNTGPTVAALEGKGTKTSGGGKRNIDMKTMGRGLAKIAAQKRG